MCRAGPDLPRPIGRERAEDLYERARALPPKARTAFLAEACESDHRLEAELGSLLTHAESTERLFAGLAGVVTSPALKGDANGGSRTRTPFGTGS